LREAKRRVAERTAGVNQVNDSAEASTDPGQLDPAVIAVAGIGGSGCARPLISSAEAVETGGEARFLRALRAGENVLVICS
jgi:hypothetical protein